MTTETNTCPHGNDFYSGCTSCTREYAQYQKALDAVEALGQGVNGGSVFVTAAALSREHAYLFDKLAQSMAMSTLMRTYDSLCPMTAAGTTVFDDRHPDHDGRLSCGTVIGALRMLAVRRTDDVLEARRFWRGKVYEGPA